MSRDDDEFVQYVEGRRAAIRSSAYLLCGDWALAEDLTQVALIKLYQAWPRVIKTNPDAYVRRIIVHAYIDETRRPWRRREVPHDCLPEPVALDEQQLARSRPSRGAMGALLGLSRQQRAALVLHYWDDLSVEEVASALGVSTNTVKTHLARALATLRASAASSSSVREIGD